MSKKKTNRDIIRSSAAEYLTFIAAGGGAETSVEMRYEDENVWLTQKMMATLYNVSVSAINQHLRCIYSDNELEHTATIKKYLIVQTEGTRDVQLELDYYSLQASKPHTESEFEKYRIIQDRLFEIDFDKMIKNLPPTSKEV
jgi:hypothetical protein